jgi:hypothetical protein
VDEFKISTLKRKIFQNSLLMGPALPDEVFFDLHSFSKGGSESSGDVIVRCRLNFMVIHSKLIRKSSEK